MMIAARLAGGNLFFAFFVVGGFLVGVFGSSSEVSDFFEGDFVVGDFGSTRSSSEHSDFFEGDFVVGDFWEHSEHSDFF